MINHRFRLKNSFQENLDMIDVCINEGSSWIAESLEFQYITISIYRTLSGRSYIILPAELRSSRKGLINIKTRIKNISYGVMLDILILQNNIQKELEKLIKNLLSILLIHKKLKMKIKSLLVIFIMLEFSFPGKKKVLAKLR